MSSKTLVVYFSRRGSNYFNGSIQNLSIGNTEIVARKIQNLAKSNLVHIETVFPYPEDYTETTEVAKNEFKGNARPLLVAVINDISSYDTIYLGYPNWWNTMPMAVFTFLESYDFSGKIIIPFCTHEGSGMGNSEKDIQKLCPMATVLPGLALYGSHVDQSDKELESWLKNLDLPNQIDLKRESK